ncbi:glycosyltransferase family 2 protein, partial [Calditrichota bacterium]
LKQEIIEHSFEIIVSDGMSDDGSRDIIAEFVKKDNRVSIINNPKKIVSSAMNNGIRNARGEIIIFINAHSKYADDFVAKCVEVMDETGADDVGGPCVAIGDGYLGTAIGLAFNSPFMGTAKYRNPNYKGKSNTTWPGCYKKSALEKIGLYDEDLVRNQDDELNYRLMKSGGVIWQDPRIRSWVTPRKSLKITFQQHRQYGYWKVKVMQKHKIPTTFRALIPGLFVSSASGLGILFLIGKIVKGKGARIVQASLLLELASYAFLSLLASFDSARKAGWKYFPIMPAVFVIYHVGYGVGFIEGIVDFIFLRKKCGKKVLSIETRDK